MSWFCLSVHLLKGFLVASSFWWIWTKLLQTLVCRLWCGHKFSDRLCEYQGVQLLDRSFHIHSLELPLRPSPEPAGWAPVSSTAEPSVTAGRKIPVDHRDPLINYNFALCGRKYSRPVSFTYLEMKATYFCPTFSNCLGVKNVKRIISFNAELISQLNLSMEIMCQMA